MCRQCCYKLREAGKGINERDQGGTPPSRVLDLPTVHMQEKVHTFLFFRKLFAICVQANLLKAEKEKLTRALVREVGEETPLSRVLDPQGGQDWRGRAQQISLLKAKISELQQAQVAPLLLFPSTV